MPITDIRKGIYDDRLPKSLRDFRNFLAHTWKCIGLPKPTRVQDDAAHFLQRGPDPTRSPFEAPNNRIFLAAFRGMGKSYLASDLADHYLALDPTLNIVVVSGAQDRATDFTQFCQKLLYEIPELAYLIPKNPERWSRNAFDVEGAVASHMPSMKSRSISGMLVGSRADILIADDIETPQNSDTQFAREKLERLASEFESICKPHARIIILGTYQTADSYYHKLPAKGYSMRVYPARYPAEPEQYQGHLAPMLMDDIESGKVGVGEPTDPKRFGELTLREKEASMGKSVSEMQLMLNPTLADRLRYPLHVGDLIIMDLNKDLAPENIVYASSPQQVIEDLPNPGFSGDRFYRPMTITGNWRPYSGSLLTVDPAGGGIDELAWIVTKVFNGRMFVLMLKATSVKPTEAELEEIAQDALDYGVNHVRVEDNFGDGMFLQLLAPVLTRIYRTKHGRGCAIDGVRHTMQKERRMLGILEPLMNMHRIVVCKSVVEYDHASTDSESKRLFFQMTRLQNLRGALVHDDRLDALAMAASYWNEIGALSLDFREEMQNAADWDEEQDFLNFLEDDGSGTHILPSDRQNNWLNHSGHNLQAFR